MTDHNFPKWTDRLAAILEEYYQAQLALPDENLTGPKLSALAPLGRTRIDSLEEAVEEIKHDLTAMGTRKRFVWLTPLDPQGQPLPQEAIAVSAILAITSGMPQPHPDPTFAEQTFTPGATIVLGRGWHVHVQETPQEVLAACGD